MTMRISTSATNRRRLRFASLDEVLADAERLATVSTRQLGSWSLGQFLIHLSTVYEKSIDGTDFRPGRAFRVLGRVVVPLWKRWVLRYGIPAAIMIPFFGIVTGVIAGIVAAMIVKRRGRS